MAFKPIDNKRDQFRKYIESNGVVEMLSKVFIQLMENPEKPEHPIDFIRENLGASLQEKMQIDLLQQEVASYRLQVEELKQKLVAVHKLHGITIDSASDITDINEPGDNDSVPNIENELNIELGIVAEVVTSAVDVPASAVDVIKSAGDLIANTVDVTTNTADSNCVKIKPEEEEINITNVIPESPKEIETIVASVTDADINISKAEDIAGTNIDGPSPDAITDKNDNIENDKQKLDSPHKGQPVMTNDGAADHVTAAE